MSRGTEIKYVISPEAKQGEIVINGDDISFISSLLFLNFCYTARNTTGTTQKYYESSVKNTGISTI